MYGIVNKAIEELVVANFGVINGRILNCEVE
jgi:hypothetical protein